MEELMFETIEYTLPLEDAQAIIWCVQEHEGRDAGIDWMYKYLARFN